MVARTPYGRQYECQVNGEICTSILNSHWSGFAPSIFTSVSVNVRSQKKVDAWNLRGLCEYTLTNAGVHVHTVSYIWN
jgi:ubiquitin-protein ligase